MNFWSWQGRGVHPCKGTTVWIHSCMVTQCDTRDGREQEAAALRGSPSPSSNRLNKLAGPPDSSNVRRRLRVGQKVWLADFKRTLVSWQSYKDFGNGWRGEGSCNIGRSVWYPTHSKHGICGGRILLSVAKADTLTIRYDDEGQVHVKAPSVRVDVLCVYQ